MAKIAADPKEAAIGLFVPSASCGLWSLQPCLRALAVRCCHLSRAPAYMGIKRAT